MLAYHYKAAFEAGRERVEQINEKAILYLLRAAQEASDNSHWNYCIKYAMDTLELLPEPTEAVVAVRPFPQKPVVWCGRLEVCGVISSGQVPSRGGPGICGEAGHEGFAYPHPPSFSFFRHFKVVF